jgi:anti-sigma factor RsiW
MNCKDVQNQFDDRLDGRLNEAQTRLFDEHVGQCAGCRADWQAHEATWALLQRWEVREPRFGFADRVMRQLDEQPEQVWPLWLRPAFRWSVAGAAALLMIGAGGFVRWQQTRGERLVSMYSQVQSFDMLRDMEVISSLDRIHGDSQL